jgi:hypothetical protein
VNIYNRIAYGRSGIIDLAYHAIHGYRFAQLKYQRIALVQAGAVKIAYVGYRKDFRVSSIAGGIDPVIDIFGGIDVTEQHLDDVVAARSAYHKLAQYAGKMRFGDTTIVYFGFPAPGRAENHQDQQRWDGD